MATSSTTQTSVNPQEGFNLIKAAAQAQAQDTQAKRSIQKNLDQQDAASEAAIVANSAGLNAQLAIDAANNSFKSGVDAQVSAMQETLGTDWTSQGSESTIWANRLKENSEKAYQSLDAINEAKSKSLVNDPIGYIMTQFTLPTDIAVYNNYAEKAQIAEGRLNEIISSSNGAAIAANNMKKQMSTELAIAEADKATATSAGQAAQLRANAAGNRIKGIEVINNLDSRQLDTVFKLHQAQNSDRSLAMQEENNKLMREERQARLDAIKTVAEEKTLALADLEAMRNSYNVGARRIGRPEILDAKIFGRMLAGSKNDVNFMNALATGQLIESAGGNSSGVPVASNAGDAAMLYASGGAKLVGNDVGQFLRDQITIAKSSPTSPKDPAGLSAHVNTQAIEVAKRQKAHISDDQPNIYAAPAPRVLLENTAVNKDPFFVSEIIPLLEADKNYKLADQTMITKAALFAGKSPADFNMAVAGVANYYKAAVVINETTKQFAENGLPKQTNYPAVIDGRVVDLTSPVEIKAALMKHLGYNRPLLDLGQLAYPSDMRN